MKETSSKSHSQRRGCRANGRLAALAIGFVALVALSGCSPCDVQTLHGLYVAPEGIVAQVGSQEEGQWGYSLFLSQDGGETWEWTSAETLGITDPAEDARGGFDGTTSAEESRTEPESPDAGSPDAEANFVDQDAAGDEEQGDSQDVEGGGFGLDPDSVDDTVPVNRTGPEYEPVRASEACLPNGRCFRTIPGEQVQEQIGGRWETSFRYTDEELRRFEARDTACTDGSSDALFGFLAVGGTASDTDQADFVVVSMGNQGVLRLDGNVDEWERIAVGELEPISTFGPRWLSFLAISPLIALALTPVVFMTNRARATANRRGAAAVIHLVLTVCLIAICGFIWLLALGGLDYAAVGLLPFIGTLGVLAVSFGIVLPRGADPSLGPPPPAGPPSPVEPPSLRH